MTWLLGVDAGLTNVKAVVFDEAGDEHAVAVRSPDNVYPEPGHVERDLDDLWDAVSGAIEEVLETPDVDPADVAGVGVAGHGHGLYLLDGDGDPLGRGIKSTDSRAADLVDEWEREGRLDEAFDIAGYEPFVADPLSILGWLKREEPDRYDRIGHVLFCKDYLKYRLTDRVCTDEMEASVFYDVDEAEYSRELLELFDLGACFDALPDVVPSWEACGTVTDEAAAETGLGPGTPVASGLQDIGATALGAGVFREGQAVLIVGTWGQSIVVRDHPDPDSEVGGINRRFLPDRWLAYKGNRSATSCVDWFVEECCADWRAEAEERGVDPYALYNERVDAVPVGAGGLVFHPYLYGSTDNPNARGGFYGLSQDHTKANMLRAIYEGVAITQCERLRELDAEGIEDARIGGGGAKSEVWTGMFADVLGDRLSVPAGTEFGALGAAVCAGVATGVYADHADAVSRTTSVARVHDPDPANVERFREVRDVFEAAVDDVAPTWERLRAAGFRG